MAKSLTRSCDTVYCASDVERNRRIGEVTSNGVVFDYTLAGSLGATFTLIREEGHSDEDLEIAAKELCRDRDVIGKIRIARVE
ncbi:hypothetical protein [Cupriavidus sp. SW-Y-13]|uniref:hypothetical protein n=1 Tax=Cupriavidus sp. SW-Y-13 TaxID=2653854 RepID=UPI001365F35C|nr:hypothetical protein [Cupriavidus sp. SW-Y-13]MWL91763.1 hypothetical protein [Cupriavidus sp. SW-Y-13]